jgi:hypothetical protein
MSKGWLLFIWSLISGGVWSVSAAAEMMFRLNVTARNLRRHPIVDQIYELKNELIKYLYQHGHCVEVKLHSQKRLCHSCDGTGVHLYSGEECWKCDGTGVFAVTQLYAFRFDIAGRRYAWHQLRKLVDYPVTLTEAEPGTFVEPTPKEDLALKLEDAWLGCCAVWWFLLLHGIKADLLLFDATRNKFRAKMIMVKRIIADLRAGLVVKKDNPLKIYERDEIDQEPLGYDGLDPKLENDDIPF